MSSATGTHKRKHSSCLLFLLSNPCHTLTTFLRQTQRLDSDDSLSYSHQNRTLVPCLPTPQAVEIILLDFEHLVQVNDLSNSAISVMTRSQLWQGLVLRAHNPGKFNHGLICRSEQIVNNQFHRVIEAGEARFHERVILQPEQSIFTSTIPNAEQIKAENKVESVVTIEEPGAGYLFVRFRYKRELAVDTEAVDVGEHLKLAYVQLDRDAVTMIRMLAESGMFDEAGG